MKKSNKTAITELSIEAMQDAIAGHYDAYGVVYVNEYMGVLANKPLGIGEKHPLNEPFRLEADHLLLFRSGRAKYVCNLEEFDVTAGMVLAMSEGTVYEIKEYSDDCRFDAVVFSPNLLATLMDKAVPYIFATQRHATVFMPSAEALGMLRSSFGNLQQMAANSDAVSATTLNYMLTGLVCLTGDLYSQQTDVVAANAPSNEQRIFNQFLEQVNANFSTHRDLAFYADKLCITVNHLSTTVSKHTGMPPSQWIEQAVISEAKVLLRHAHLSVAEVTYALNFASVSFFCKYFRRLTGTSPKKYAQGRASV